MTQSDLLTACRHDFAADLETNTIICQKCGFVVPIIRDDGQVQKVPNGQSSIVSAGMIHPLGSAVDVRELNRTKVLEGALKDLFDGTDKKTFWIELTQQLKEKGYTEPRIAEKSEYLRRAIAREKSEVWHDILEILREALGVEV